MIYISANPLDADSARKRLEWLIQNNRTFEITERKRQRTTNQNAYLHACINYYAAKMGEKADYVKQYIFKASANRDLFIREKDDKVIGHIRYLRSSADLTKDEMSLALDRFRDWSAQNAGLYIPSADDYLQVEAMLQEIERAKEFI